MVPSPLTAAHGRQLTVRRCDLLAARVPALRTALLRERDFRREQLAQLNGPGPCGRTSPRFARGGAACDPAPGLGEVQALVESGARRALDDIELALARLRTGDYGRCRRCDVDIPLAVLDAIPQTTLCLPCRRAGQGRVGYRPGR